MQRMHPSLAVCLFAMIATASLSHAAYTGVTLQLHTTIQAPTGTKKVFRLYANFSQGSDEVVSWGGTPQNGSTIFKTGPCQDTVFFQSGANAAPSQEAIDKNPLAQWDTFATIGVNIAEQGVPYDQAFFTPGFPNIAGSMVNISNAVILILPGSPQARADFAGDGDPQLRVLLAQLAVELKAM
jgi:hypothetical protein